MSATPQIATAAYGLAAGFFLADSLCSLLNLAEDGSEAEILLAETDEQVALIASPNQVEAVMRRVCCTRPYGRGQHRSLP